MAKVTFCSETLPRDGFTDLLSIPAVKPYSVHLRSRALSTKFEWRRQTDQGETDFRRGGTSLKWLGPIYLKQISPPL